MIEWLEKAIDFSNILNVSITASWLILVVIGLRLVLKKAPKWVNVALWGIVAIRLLMPFSIESSLSLIPSAETVSDQLLQAEPAYSHQAAQLDIVTNSNYGSIISMELDGSMESVQWSMVKMSLVWYAGIALMSIYTAVSYLILRRKLRTAVILKDNLFQCETVSSPFVLGILKPKIYLPYTMDDLNLRHVVAHEQAHIRRKDHWWKPLGFLLLTIHWFNPLMWVAYILLCRDIELACDEKVIAELGSEQRADYTQALVACAVNRHMIAACPLAFGEVGVKERVKSIMNYRKPTFWIIVTALVVCVVVAACFLTNPVAGSKILLSGDYGVDKVLYAVTVGDEISTETPFQYRVTADYHLYSQQSKDEDWIHLGSLAPYSLTNDELKNYMPMDEMRKDAKVSKITDAYILKVTHDNFYLVFQTNNGKTYLAYGWEDMGERGQPGSDDTRLRRLYRLESTPGSYVTKWFDYTEDPSEMSYDDELKIQLDEFPDITFKYTPYEIIATTSWEDSDLVGNTILISGMPIWNAYFCDLTGDGLPEICSQVSYGSGMIDNRVIIIDYANGISYKLENRGSHDYYLRMNDADGYLYVDKRVYNSDELVSSGRLVFKDGSIQIEGVNPEPVTILRAKILEIHDGYFLVEPVEGSSELSSADKIEIPMKNMSPSPEPQVGDILEIEYDGQIQETYPARISNPYSIRVVKETETWDLIPMVMVNGTLYLDTGMESTVEARCGMMDGEITSQVDGSEEPSIDDQSNFGTGYGYQYGTTEGTIELYMNGKWWIFATEEARYKIQFPTSEIESELMIDPTVPAYVVNLTTGEEKPITSNEDIRTIQTLISTEWWAEGTTDCLNDFKITIDGGSYLYHSDCGTFTDTKNDRCITLNDEQIAEINRICTE